MKYYDTNNAMGSYNKGLLAIHAEKAGLLLTTG